MSNWPCDGQNVLLKPPAEPFLLALRCRCGKRVGRMRNTIKVQMHVCVACGGPFKYLGTGQGHGGPRGGGGGGGGGAGAGAAGGGSATEVKKVG